MCHSAAVLRFAHILTPLARPPLSELGIAQPITFESMRRARALASSTVEVELLATCLPEDAAAIPADFRAVPPLSRSVLDTGTFRMQRRLPLLRDILERLVASTDAEYVLYTNVDIALQPHFYVAVAEYIAQGYDAFVINRRTISQAHSRLEDLPYMYAEIGKPHRGYDCFVFRRDAFARYIIGDVCLGMGHVDTPLVCSMIAHAHKFIDVTDAHLTFHLGDSKTWWKWQYRDYLRHNDTQACRSLLQIAKDTGVSACIRPHVRAMLALGIPHNGLIVREWKRLYGHA
jgi:hypothetical protein